MDLWARGDDSARSQWTVRTLGPVTPTPVRPPRRRRGARVALPGGGARPDTTPDAVLAALRAGVSAGFSGTGVSHLSLGAPAAPSAPVASSAASLDALLDGSHTLQVWYGGVDRQRVALLGASGETDLFRSGRELWQWDSARRVAVQLEVPPGNRPLLSVALLRAADTTSLTPSGLAGTALAALDAATTISIGRDVTVADRPAYDLVLTPHGRNTRIGSVHVAVDGAAGIPLAVQVYPRGSDEAAIDVAFTRVRLSRPSAAYFRFAPPAGATVRRSPAAPTPSVRILGSGWSSVLAAPGVGPLGLGPSLVDAMTPVAGSWGRGRVLHTDLISVLLTDDRRLFVGAVEPHTLYAAAAR